jgi:hypothetical protein
MSRGKREVAAVELAKAIRSGIQSIIHQKYDKLMIPHAKTFDKMYHMPEIHLGYRTGKLSIRMLP